MLKEYYEAKVMQSMGLLDSSVNPVEYADWVVEQKEQDKQEEPNYVELENHMVINGKGE